MSSAGEIQRGNLKVATVDVSLVERYTAVDRYLLVGAAPHGVIGTFHHCVAFRVGEAHGAVFRVVDRASQMSAELYDTCVPKISPVNGDLWKYNVQWTMYKVEVPRAAGSPDLEPAQVRAAYSSPRCSRVSGGTVGSLEKTNRTPPDGGVA